MNRFIWTEKQVLGKDVIFSNKIENPSLATEIESVVDKTIYVNTASRFPFLLSSDINSKISAVDFNALMHYISEIDMLSGLEKSNILLDKIKSEINDGLYGKKTTVLFRRFSLEKQNRILKVIMRYGLGNVEGFIKSVDEVINDSKMYKGQGLIYIYIDKDENSEDLELIEFCRIMFLPIDIELKIHFINHMGIIGCNETMKIGKIRIV